MATEGSTCVYRYPHSSLPLYIIRGGQKQSIFKIDDEGRGHKADKQQRRMKHDSFVTFLAYLYSNSISIAVKLSTVGQIVNRNFNGSEIRDTDTEIRRAKNNFEQTETLVT